MNPISNNTESLAQALLNLSSQTQPASSSADDGSGQLLESLAPASDTLTLSSSQSTSASDPNSIQVAQQNFLSALADPSEALAATQSAVSLINSQPDSAILAQSGQNAQAVMGLVG
jgi:hypothetical protein